MVDSLQSGLQILCQSFCNVVAEEDKDVNVVISPDGEPKMNMSNPHVELPYTYLMA